MLCFKNMIRYERLDISNSIRAITSYVASAFFFDIVYAKCRRSRLFSKHMIKYDRIDISDQYVVMWGPKTLPMPMWCINTLPQSIAILIAICMTISLVFAIFLGEETYNGQMSAKICAGQSQVMFYEDGQTMVRCRRQGQNQNTQTGRTWRTSLK